MLIVKVCEISRLSDGILNFREEHLDFRAGPLREIGLRAPATDVAATVGGAFALLGEYAARE